MNLYFKKHSHSLFWPYAKTVAKEISAPFLDYVSSWDKITLVALQQDFLRRRTPSKTHAFAVAARYLTRRQRLQSRLFASSWALLATTFFSAGAGASLVIAGAEAFAAVTTLYLALRVQSKTEHRLFKLVSQNFRSAAAISRRNSMRSAIRQVSVASGQSELAQPAPRKPNLEQAMNEWTLRHGPPKYWN